jgi:signal transduction histidine kinase
MRDRSEKQIYAVIVLPAVLFSLIACLLTVRMSGFGTESVLLCLCSLIFISISLMIARRLARSVKQLMALCEEALPESDPPCGRIFGHIDLLLKQILNRMKAQESELQREKLRRLRSVIDGQDQERNRLSRELHDGVGQSLIAIKLQLENAETQNYSMMRAGIDSAKSRIDLTIEDVRRVCNALLPAALSEFGIVSTLRALCSELSSLAGFRASFENEGSLDRLPKKSQVYLYRIAQEALNNIAKHARASEVVMKLSRHGDRVTLEVRDNGKGFIFDPISFAQRNGLQNMRERTYLLQGDFSIVSAPGEGTTIRVTIPYMAVNGKDQADSGG